MKGCLNCGKPFEPKRERAIFCSDLCRATFHQRKRIADKKVARAKELTFKVANLEKSEKAAKLWDELLKEMGPIDYRPTTEQSFDGEKQDPYIQDEVGQTPPPPKQEPPVQATILSYQELLRLAPSMDTREKREEFWRLVARNRKINANQKDALRLKLPKQVDP